MASDRIARGLVQRLSEAFGVAAYDPDQFSKELRLAAAVKWYEMRAVSQARAAEIAGLSRAEFITELSRFRVSPFQETLDELTKEVGGG